MSPIGMSVLLLSTLGFFAWTARRRWKLMMIGRNEDRTDNIPQRITQTLKYAFGQAKMPRYRWTGVAHILVFSGFMVLLLRSLVLWGRGFDESFNLWILNPVQPVGAIYAVLKDSFALLVILGVLIFFYFRAVKKLKRLTLSTEGLIILGIILTMMVSDIVYDGARMAHATATQPGDHFHSAEYAGAIVGRIISSWNPTTLRIIEHVGFWTHASLVLIFLNILPYSKHFHIITAIPNVFAASLHPAGRLDPIVDLEGCIEREETLGVATINDFSWKSIVDFYTCTECGRCTDVCPAANTGKLLSPKQLTVDLRDHLYSRQDEVMKLGDQTNDEGAQLEPIPLVSDELIKPEVLWACTTCRACEEECPVLITYVDKIVDLRRQLVMEQAAFPDELQNAFRGMETSGNPWSYSPDERIAWTAGLDIPLISEKPDADVLLWVGCAPAFDARARKVTIATAKLLQHAGVDFAILGTEETCTGDPARRAGNEFLFQMFAEQNCETLNNYNVKKVLATCPHCFNSLKNEYGDFGGHFEVMHHSEYLAELIREGKLKPQHEVPATVTYHDSCYLGRYNDVYDSPREILSGIPGVQLVEPSETRDRGMCCGAGGAQMFKEEEHGDQRVNAERTDQLLKVLNNDRSHNNIVSSACPFCMRMVTDGLADKEREDVQQLDIAEVLYKSVLDAPESAAASPSSQGTE